MRVVSERMRIHQGRSRQQVCLLSNTRDSHLATDFLTIEKMQWYVLEKNQIIPLIEPQFRISPPKHFRLQILAHSRSNSSWVWDAVVNPSFNSNNFFDVTPPKRGTISLHVHLWQYALPRRQAQRRRWMISFFGLGNLTCEAWTTFLWGKVNAPVQ